MFYSYHADLFPNLYIFCCNIKTCVSCRVWSLHIGTAPMTSVSNCSEQLWLIVRPHQAIPIISETRFLEKKGELLEMSRGKTIVNMRMKFNPVNLFLFNDLLIIAVKKRYGRINFPIPFLLLYTQRVALCYGANQPSVCPLVNGFLFSSATLSPFTGVW